MDSVAGVLRAFNAETLNEIWNSEQNTAARSRRHADEVRAASRRQRPRLHAEPRQRRVGLWPAGAPAGSGSVPGPHHQHRLRGQRSGSDGCHRVCGRRCRAQLERGRRRLTSDAAPARRFDRRADLRDGDMGGAERHLAAADHRSAGKRPHDEGVSRHREHDAGGGHGRGSAAGHLRRLRLCRRGQQVVGPVRHLHRQRRGIDDGHD